MEKHDTKFSIEGTFENEINVSNPSEPKTLEEVQARMHAIVKRQKAIIKRIEKRQTDVLVSEFKDLGEEYSKLSLEFMRLYFHRNI